VHQLPVDLKINSPEYHRKKVFESESFNHFSRGSKHRQSLVREFEQKQRALEKEGKSLAHDFKFRNQAINKKNTLSYTFTDHTEAKK
jgi:hypothetical protein